jgi:hypothetical protein
MSCTTSAAWSRLVLSLCCTEPGPSRGADLSGRITTVAMFWSCQLGLCCTVKPNCSGMSARLAGTSVICNCVLDTCETSCVAGAARPFFIPVVCSPLEAVGYVAAPELSSRGGEVRAMGHVAASEPTSAGRQGPELKNAWRRQSSTQQGDKARGHGPRGSTGAHLSKEVRSGVAGHVAAPEPTSVGRCDPKLQIA